MIGIDEKFTSFQVVSEMYDRGVSNMLWRVSAGDNFLLKTKRYRYTAATLRRWRNH